MKKFHEFCKNNEMDESKRATDANSSTAPNNQQRKAVLGDMTTPS